MGAPCNAAGRVDARPGNTASDYLPFIIGETVSDRRTA
jgi:hypothetical protein